MMFSLGKAGRRAPRNSLHCISDFYAGLKLLQDKFKREPLWKDYRKTIIDVVHTPITFDRK